MDVGSQQVLAVNSALLLPAEVVERVIRLNALLYAEQPAGFLFGPTMVPHITLGQLYIRAANLLALIKRLDTLLFQTAPMELSVSKLVGRHQVVSLRVTRTPELLRLHANFMDEAKAFSEPDGTIESFYAPDIPAREKDAEYVAGFRKRSSYSRYVPHITIGYGHPPVPDVFLDFACSEVGLFQLGRFCTCRQLQHRWNLHS
jgi:2'-5' RNA ligase